jgi:hypothetical protein
LGEIEKCHGQSFVIAKLIILSQMLFPNYYISRFGLPALTALGSRFLPLAIG